MITAAKNKSLKKSKNATAGLAAGSSKSCSEISSEQITYELIAKRAYQLWEHSGYAHGNHEKHWLQAEKELNGNKQCTQEKG